MENWALLIAPFGVLAAIGLTWLCGGLVDGKIVDAEDGAARLRELEPGFEVAEVSLARGGAGALAIGRRGGRPALAVLFVVGDGLVSRELAAGAVTVSATAEGMLVLRSRDFTSPRIELDMGPELAERWQRRLIPLLARAPGADHA